MFLICRGVHGKLKHSFIQLIVWVVGLSRKYLPRPYSYSWNSAKLYSVSHGTFAPQWSLHILQISGMCVYVSHINKYTYSRGKTIIYNLLLMYCSKKTIYALFQCFSNLSQKKNTSCLPGLSQKLDPGEGNKHSFNCGLNSEIYVQGR